MPTKTDSAIRTTSPAVPSRGAIELPAVLVMESVVMGRRNAIANIGPFKRSVNSGGARALARPRRRRYPLSLNSPQQNGPA
jgi:hypothetical protein